MLYRHLVIVTKNSVLLNKIFCDFCVMTDTNLAVKYFNVSFIQKYFRRENGCAGFFHVIEKYRKQGLGSKLCQKFIKQLGESGQDLVTSIFPENLVSAKIFQNLGFQKFGADVRMKIEKV